MRTNIISDVKSLEIDCVAKIAISCGRTIDKSENYAALQFCAR